METGFRPGLACCFSSLPHLSNSSDFPTVISTARWHPGIHVWALVQLNQFFALLWAKLCFSYNGDDRWHFTNTRLILRVPQWGRLYYYPHFIEEESKTWALCPSCFSNSSVCYLNQRVSKYLPISRVLVRSRDFQAASSEILTNWVNVEWSPVICFQQTSLMKAGFKSSQWASPFLYILLGTAASHVSLLINHSLWFLRAHGSHAQYSRNHGVC